MQSISGRPAVLTAEKPATICSASGLPSAHSHCAVPTPASVANTGSITQRRVSHIHSLNRACFVIEDDRDRQAVLAHLRQQLPPDRPHLLYIDSAQALDTQNLLRKITVADGRYQVSPQGRLYGQEPEIVVVDITTMPPDAIASLNDLFDDRPSCQGRPLGPDIGLVLITSKQTQTMLGQDHRRRTRRFTEKPIPYLANPAPGHRLQTDSLPPGSEWLKDRESTSNIRSNRASDSEPFLIDEELLAARILPLDRLNKPAGHRVTVDFYLNHDWRTPLLGGPMLNQGTITYTKGCLTQLQSGEELVLRNAPWQAHTSPDQPPSDFKKTLLTALREKGFEHHGQWLPIPENIAIYRDDISAEELRKKWNLYQVELDPGVKFIRVNKATLDFLNNSIRINNNNDLERFNPLAEWAGDCQPIRITEDLSLRQSLQFFRYYEDMEPAKRPQLVRGDCETNKEKTTPRFSVQDRDIDYVALKDSLIVQDTMVSWDKLFQRTCLKSRQQNKFGYENHKGGILDWFNDDSSLSPGVLYISGIEANSKTAKKFLTLNENPPYLFIHGRKTVIPDSAKHKRIILLPPSGTIKPLTKESVELFVSRYMNYCSTTAETIKKLAFSLDKILTLCNRLNEEIIAQHASLQRQSHTPKSVYAVLRQLERHLRSVYGSDGIQNEHGIFWILLKIARQLVARPWRMHANIYGFILCQFRQTFPEAVEYPLFYQPSLSGWLNYTSSDTAAFSLTGYRPPVPKADRDGLRSWLRQHPAPNRNTLRAHFWSLARYCPVWEFDTLPGTLASEPDDNSLEQLAGWLVGAAEPEQQSTLASSLEIATDSGQHRHYYSGQTVKQLNRWLEFHQHDILVKRKKEALQTIFGQLSDIVVILEQPNLSELDKIKQVTPLLTRNITGHGQLPPGFCDFPHALVFSRQHSYLDQRQRLDKLGFYIRGGFPIIFLNGKSGTGKSSLAEKAVTLKLNSSHFRPDHPVQQLTLDSRTTQEDLFAREVIRKRDDGDEYSVYEQGPLLKFDSLFTGLRTPYPVLKGANQVNSGVLLPLAGLATWSVRRKISFSGQCYGLSHHRSIIFTGNLEADESKKLDPALVDAVVTLNIPTTTVDELAQGIIRPALPGHWSARLKGHACGTLLALLQQYQHLLSEHLLTPTVARELLAIIKHALASYHAHAPNTLGEPDIPMVNGLILDAFRLRLDNRIATDQQSQLTNLQAWCQARFPENHELLIARDQQFNRFLALLRKRNSHRVLNVPPLVELVRQYWLFLEQGDTGGKVLMVDGPSGGGKDCLLDAVLSLWNEQRPKASRSALHLTASAGQWDYLTEQVLRAAHMGQVIAISELNLIDPDATKALLNSALNKAKPGFQLIATVNPNAFPGRKPFSPDLKKRFIRFSLAPLSRDDIEKALTQLAGSKGSSDMVDWLTRCFINLNEALAVKQSSLSPSLAELDELVKRLREQPKPRWRTLFSAFFDKELKAVALSVDDLSVQLPPEPNCATTTDATILRMPDEHKDLAALSGLPDYLINPEKYDLNDADLVWPGPPVYKGPSYRGSVPAQQMSVLGDSTGQVNLNLHEPSVGNRYSPGGDRLDNFAVQLYQIHESPVPMGNEAKMPDIDPVSISNKVTGEPVCSKQSNKRYESLPEEAASPDHFVTGNITRHVNFKYHKRFASNRYSPVDYRLNIFELVFNTPSQLIHCAWVNPTLRVSPPATLAPSPIEHFVDLPPEHVLGAQCINLDQHNWFPLPGLSPMDELIAIRSRNRPNLRFELARSSTTGQLLVRLQQGSGKLPVQLDFVITPSEQRLPETVETMPGSLLDKTIHTQLHEFILHRLIDTENPLVDIVFNIQNKQNKKKQINQLAQWLRTFRSNKDVEGKGLPLLCNLIIHQQGTCLHRAVLFELLARFLGVPARQVANDCHRYVEYSPDQGQSWYKLNLGGGTNFSLNESSEDFLNTRPIKEPEPAPIQAEEIHRWLDKINLAFQSGNNRHQVRGIFESDAFIQNLRQLPAGDKLATKLLEQAQRTEVYPNNTIHNTLRLLNVFFSSSSLRPTALLTVAEDMIKTAGENRLPTVDILPMLEAMTRFTATRTRTTGLLNRFYQATFSQSHDWAFKHQPPTAAGSMPESSYLGLVLNRSVPAIGYSGVPTGHPPSLERMVAGLDAFPKSVPVSGGRNPAVIHLQGPWLKRLVGLLPQDTAPHAHDKDGLLVPSRLTPLFTEQFAISLHTFLHWLAAHEGPDGWCWLVSREANDPMGGTVKVSPGRYPTPPPITAVKALLHTATCETELNLMRLKTASDISEEACYLNSEQMEILFREFLQQSRSAQLH